MIRSKNTALLLVTVIVSYVTESSCMCENKGMMGRFVYEAGALVMLTATTTALAAARGSRIR